MKFTTTGKPLYQMTNTRRLILASTFLIAYIMPIAIVEASSFSSSDPIEGRYSFSLTTFHPSGKLPQLSHAIKASTIGPVIVATHISGNGPSNENAVILSSIQNLSSPLIEDDGTARFVRITDGILMGHTGVNADGRVVLEASQRLAVDHAYTFGEEIPINALLEEISLLFQEYTMKAGVRPFGCCVIVASISEGLFSIDPSGAVTKLDDVAAIGSFSGESGNDGAATLSKSDLVVKIREKLKDVKVGERSRVENVLMEALRDGAGYSSENISASYRPGLSFIRKSSSGKKRGNIPSAICASAYEGQGFHIRRSTLPGLDPNKDAEE
uniref:Proteasome endopeptidase complex n=1 Tax=Chaetoceros debilis TaxID=122233 RepID=A0A7S3VH10_9STRA|mmetsp:Transcript_29049/g.44328  ORF Transcript_29049/g.44328 Transcript_29049/m.44328 type:complete len:327 (-) Transcript_29049:48-1028(-)